MTIKTGYLLRIGYWFTERCESYRGVALSDPVIVDAEKNVEKFDDPMILGYCEVQDEGTPEFIWNIEDARKYWRFFADRNIPTMLLGVAYSDKDPTELADYKPKQGTFLGFDVAVLGGNFESLVMYWVVQERWYDGIEKKPEYPVWHLIKLYFRLRLTDSGLLRSAEDALLLTRLEKVVSSLFEKDWHEPPATPCCITLIEDFPKMGESDQWPGFIGQDRFSKGHAL